MAEGQADKLAAGKGCKNGTLALTESDKGKSFEIEQLPGGIVVSRVFRVSAKTLKMLEERYSGEIRVL